MPYSPKPVTCKKCGATRMLTDPRPSRVPRRCRQCPRPSVVARGKDSCACGRQKMVQSPMCRACSNAAKARIRKGTGKPKYITFIAKCPRCSVSRTVTNDRAHAKRYDRLCRKCAHYLASPKKHSERQRNTAASLCRVRNGDPEFQKRATAGHKRKYVEDPEYAIRERERGRAWMEQLNADPDMRAKIQESSALWYLPKDVRDSLSTLDRIKLSDTDVRRSIIIATAAALCMEIDMTNIDNLEIGGIGHVSDQQAKKWAAEYMRLHKKLGRQPTWEDLVEMARNPRSSWHSRVWEKSDEEAALAWLILQVQDIARHIAAISSDGSKFRLLVRGKDGVEFVTEVEPDGATAEAVRRKLLSELESAQRRLTWWSSLLDTKAQASARKVQTHLTAATAIVESTATEPKRKKRAA